MAEALLVTEYFPPVVGGAARWFDVVARNARELRWTFVTQPVPGAPHEEVYCGHRVIRPSWWEVPGSLFKWRTAAVYFRMYRFLDELCSSGAFEALHAMPAYGAALPASLVARKHAIPLVTHVFGEEFGMQGKSAYRRAVMRRVLSRSAAVVAISTATREQAIQRGASPAKTQILIAADLSRLAPQPKESSRHALGITGHPVLLTVSRIVERKGHDQVLRAIPALISRHPDIEYVIAGEGPDRPRLEALAASLGITRRVRFLGLVPEEKLAALYSAADLFVMPNRELPSGEIEGFGLVLLEAGACGVPSIAGRSGGSASAMSDGKTGFLVDPLDTNELSRTIGMILDDETLRRRLGDEARRFSIEEFDAASVVGRLERIHRSGEP